MECPGAACIQPHLGCRGSGSGWGVASQHHTESGDGIPRTWGGEGVVHGAVMVGEMELPLRQHRKMHNHQ